MIMDKRSYYWIKLHTAYLSNSKFLMLSTSAKYHYIVLYLLSCEGDSGGVLVQNEEVLSVKEMAFLLHEDENNLKKSIEELVKVGLILDDGNGVYTISRFLEDQGKVSFGAEEDKKKQDWRQRQAKHRNKARNLTPKNETRTGDSQSYSDKELDVEEKIEKETEGYPETYTDSNSETYSDSYSDSEIDEDIDEDIEGHVIVTGDTCMTSSVFFESRSNFLNIFDLNQEYTTQEYDLIVRRLWGIYQNIEDAAKRACVFQDLSEILCMYFPNQEQAFSMPNLEATINCCLWWMKNYGITFDEVIKAKLRERLQANPETEEWGYFISYVNSRMEYYKEPIDAFIEWFIDRGYDILDVSPDKMIDIYHKDFIPELSYIDDEIE